MDTPPSLDPTKPAMGPMSMRRYWSWWASMPSMPVGMPMGPVMPAVFMTWGSIITTEGRRLVVVEPMCWVCWGWGEICCWWWGL